MRELLEVCGFIWAALAAIFLAVIVPVNFAQQYGCGKYEENTGRETRWAHFDACYINAGDEWLTKEEYKAAKMAKDGLTAK